MNLILYAPSETSFDSNGLGVLREVMNDEVHEVMNGKFELHFQYPVVGRLFQQIVLDAYVTAAPDPLRKPQPFRIYRISKARGGWVTVDARHIAYQLKRCVCANLNLQGVVSGWMPQLASYIYPASPFSFSSDIDKNCTLRPGQPMNAWDLMGSGEKCLLKVVGGEYEFDGYQVKLHARRGADRGVRIRYGKNLKDLTLDRVQGVPLHAVYPYAIDEDGNVYELPEKYIVFDGVSEQAEVTLHPLDLSGMIYSGKPIEDIYETLRGWVSILELLVKLAGGWDATPPETSLTVDFVRLSETVEYKDRPLPDTIALGDTIHVEDPELGVSVSARVSEMRYQPSTDRIKSITLGNVKRSLVRTIASRTTAAQMEIRLDDETAAAAAAGISLL